MKIQQNRETHCTQPIRTANLHLPRRLHFAGRTKSVCICSGESTLNKYCSIDTGLKQPPPRCLLFAPCMGDTRRGQSKKQQNIFRFAIALRIFSHEFLLKSSLCERRKKASGSGRRNELLSNVGALCLRSLSYTAQSAQRTAEYRRTRLESMGLATYMNDFH